MKKYVAEYKVLVEICPQNKKCLGELIKSISLDRYLFGSLGTVRTLSTDLVNLKETNYGI